MLGCLNNNKTIIIIWRCCVIQSKNYSMFLRLYWSGDICTTSQTRVFSADQNILQSSAICYVFIMLYVFKVNFRAKWTSVLTNTESLELRRRPWWSSGYRVCHWTQSSQVQSGWVRWIFKSNKNPYHDFLRREVEPLAPCHMILRHVKEPCGVWKRYFAGKIDGHLSPSFFLIRY
jgi:hypothetical protein